MFAKRVAGTFIYHIRYERTPFSCEILIHVVITYTIITHLFVLWKMLGGREGKGHGKEEQKTGTGGYPSLSFPFLPFASFATKYDGKS